MLTGRGRFAIGVRRASRSRSSGQALRVLRSRSASARFARCRDFNYYKKGRKQRFKKGGREMRLEKGVGKGDGLRLEAPLSGAAGARRGLGQVHQGCGERLEETVV